jgi:hypothetical protein
VHGRVGEELHDATGGDQFVERVLGDAQQASKSTRWYAIGSSAGEVQGDLVVGGVRATDTKQAAYFLNRQQQRQIAPIIGVNTPTHAFLQSNS